MKVSEEGWAFDEGIKTPIEGLRPGAEVPHGFALIKAWVWTGDPLSVGTGSIFIKLMWLGAGTGESRFLFSIQKFFEDGRRPAMRACFWIEDMTEADIPQMLESIEKNPLVVEGSRQEVEAQDAPF